MNLVNALLYLFPQASPLYDYRIIDDGTGAKIGYWALPSPLPTDAELAAASAAYDAAQPPPGGTLTVVGKDVSKLTADERTQLLTVLAERAGLVDKNGKVKL